MVATCGIQTQARTDVTQEKNAKEMSVAHTTPIQIYIYILSMWKNGERWKKHRRKENLLQNNIKFVIIFFYLDSNQHKHSHSRSHPKTYTRTFTKTTQSRWMINTFEDGTCDKQIVVTFSSK